MDFELQGEYIGEHKSDEGTRKIGIQVIGVLEIIRIAPLPMLEVCRAMVGHVATKDTLATAN